MMRARQGALMKFKKKVISGSNQSFYPVSGEVLQVFKKPSMPSGPSVFLLLLLDVKKMMYIAIQVNAS